jgi:hypothetical protein
VSLHPLEGVNPAKASSDDKTCAPDRALKILDCLGIGNSSTIDCIQLSIIHAEPRFPVSI